MKLTARKMIAKSWAGALVSSCALLIVGVAASSVSAAPEAKGAAAGAKIFAAKCQACHQVDAAKGSGLGPNLAGVVGRKAGSVSRFNYSPAMTRSGIQWSKAQLDAFLTRPQKAIPGNRMSFVGLQKAEDRAAVIAFLSTKK